jgi:hypothetical protein
VSAGSAGWLPSPGRRALQALWLDDEPAPVAVSFDRWELQIRGDSLSGITYCGALILHAIRVVIRDRDWNTVPADVAAVTVDSGPDGLTVDLSSRNREGDLDFAWTGRLHLQRGSLRFSFEGIACAPLWRNRIGMVLLHPAELAGVALTVHHPQGSPTQTTFPSSISPHQPARDIAGLDWGVGDVSVSATLQGDVFELEDQRNWTDASFKTYSTPLELPFPVRMDAGERISQAVVLTCRQGSGEPSRVFAGPSTAPVTLVRAGHTVPRFAVGAATAPAPQGLPAEPLPWLQGVGLLVELDLSAANWPAALARAQLTADGAALDVRLVTDDAGQLAGALDALAGLPLARMGVFGRTSHVSEPPLLQALVEQLDARGMATEVLAGTRAHFTELNRMRDRPPDSAGAVTFSVTPQMHDLSRPQLVGSVPMMRLVAEQAVRIAAPRPVHVGPVTLRSRFNAVATSTPRVETNPSVESGYAAEYVPGATDPRQLGVGFAAWLVASAAALSVPGIASVCYAEAWGPRGFGEIDGRPFPGAEALGWLAEVSGWEICAVRGRLPADVGVLAARQGASIVVLVANLSDRRSALVVDPGPVVSVGGLQRLGDAVIGLGDHLPDGLLRLDLGPAEVVRWTARTGAEEAT